jgi:hypothetical protein
MSIPMSMPMPEPESPNAMKIKFRREGSNRGTLHIYSDDSETFVEVDNIRDLLSNLNKPISSDGVYVGHSEGNPVYLHSDADGTKLVCEAYEFSERVDDLARIIGGASRRF